MPTDDNSTFQSEEVPTKEEIERRIDDWLKRLSSLFAETAKWAQEHAWTVSDVGTIPMLEELMRDYGIPGKKQPTLSLNGGEGAYALFKPKGLWVIGANGRIDLYTAKGAYVIVDSADPFSNPNWMVFRVSDKLEGTPYEPKLLAEIA